MTAVDPIAIVGMACRFPGGIDTPEDYWKLLIDGGDTVAELPPDRWASYQRAEQAAALRRTTRLGSFLPCPGAFDAAFFGVTPREAELMDPQQRLALETTWESLEHAGIPPSGLAGTDTGVFMGVGSDDYGRQMLEDLPRIEAWTGVGAAPCVVANRVSYLLDLRGPSYSVDAACASSLVAVHLAAQSLRQGECSLAVAGGVNVIAGPGLTMVLDAAEAISPNGRSRPFDADADGYGRGEGIGVVVLKRLQDARRAGDRILALLRGSAVNQDGRTNGIMAPNGDAQEQVIRLALRQAGIDPSTVGYVEAHGTGTRAGDPIEATALSRVFGTGRRADRPCLIGSAKGNIGHLEGGAGIAGLMKAVLALRYGEIPPQAGFRTPNPAIPWEGSGLRVAAERMPWPDEDRPRRAGVSSFGYGGTVGHVVLEQAPPEAAPALQTPPGPSVFPISGASAAAVRDYAGRLAALMKDESRAPALRDLRHSLWCRRTHLPERAGVVARDAASLRYELGRLAADQPSPGVTTGRVIDGASSAVWVFSGHGSQWSGMGRELLTSESAFAEVVDAIDPVFREEIGFSPREVLMTGDLGDVDRIQCMIFVVHVGLAAVWRRLGLRPAAVIGHSVGEVAAAVTAGVLGLTDGARLICRRSILLRRVAGHGAMAMVRLPFETVRELLDGNDGVQAAIESSSVSTVVAGDPDGVAAFRARLSADNVVVRTVASNVAFHTGQMDPLLDDLRDALADIVPKTPEVPLYTTALTDPRARSARDGAYWAANLRNPVRLAGAVGAAAEDGHRLFLEVSPHPVVTYSIGETLTDLGIEEYFTTGSLRRDQPERVALLTNLAALHCHGCHVDPKSHGAGGGLVTLPRMAWRHRHFWRAPAPGTAWEVGVHDAESCSLLGSAVTIADPAAPSAWRTLLNLDNRPYPGSHPVQGVEIVPAAVLVNTFFAATGVRSLRDVRFDTPVPVTGESHEVQVLRKDGVARIVSRPLGDDGDDHPWQTHTSAVAVQPGPPRGTIDRAGLPRDLPPETVVERLAATGIAGVGLSWTVRRLSAGDGEILAWVGFEQRGGWAHLMDAVTSIAPLVLGDEPVLRLLAGVRRIDLGEPPAGTALIRIRRDAGTEDGADAVVAGAQGDIAGVLEGMRFAAPEGDTGTSVSPRRLLHRLEWRPLPEAVPSRPVGTIVLVGGDTDLMRELSRHAGAQGVRTLRVAEPDELTGLPAGMDRPDAVLVVGGPPGPGLDLAEAAEANAWTLARAAQVMAGAGAPRSTLWCVTAGLREAADAGRLAQAPLWGLGRIIAGENPDLWGGIVDLDSGDLSTAVGSLLTVLGRGGAPDLLAPRAGVIEAARLVPVIGEPGGEALRCRADATYLITGGLGVLGLRVAEWLVTRGARRLVLTARTPMPPRGAWDGVLAPAVRTRVEAIRALERSGVTVRTLDLEVTDGEAAAARLTPDAFGLPPIRGVVHAAGVLDDRLIRDLDRESLRTVMRPKVEGALVLDRLFPPGSLDFLVLFSSIGQFLGLTGQASYAGANAFLDALAAHRRAAGDHHTVSLCWTSWRGMGMAVNDVVDHELRDRGVGAVSAAEAFRAWEAGSGHDLDRLCVFPTGDAPSRVLPVLSELDFAAGADGGQDGADDGAVLAGLSPEQLREVLVAEVAGQVGAEMKAAPEDLDVRLPLTSLGLDSVMTMGIRRRLEKRFRLELPAALLWDRPTVAGIGDYLAERLTPDLSGQ